MYVRISQCVQFFIIQISTTVCGQRPQVSGEGVKSAWILGWSLKLLYRVGIGKEPPEIPTRARILEHLVPDSHRDPPETSLTG